MRAIKKGIRFHDIQQPVFDKKVEYCKNNGFGHIQLVLEKSIDGHSATKFSKNYALQLKEKFKPLKIAVLGCYINPSTLHNEILEKQLEKFEETVRYANVLRPIVVGTETGFCGEQPSDLDASEFAYQRLLTSMKRLVKTAEQYDVCIGVEGVHCFVINTPQKMKRLLDDLSSKHVKVIFDPVNYLNAFNYNEQNRMIMDVFTLFAEKIAVIHAKDFIVENGALKRVPLGQGLLHYKLIFEQMEKYHLDIPIITEEYTENQAKAGLEYLEQKYANLLT